MKKEESIEKLDNIINDAKKFIIDIEMWRNDFIDFHIESISEKPEELDNLVGIIKNNDKNISLLFYEKYKAFTKTKNNLIEFEQMEKNIKRTELIDEMIN